MKRVRIEATFEFDDAVSDSDSELGKAVYESIELAREILTTPSGAKPLELQLSHPVISSD